MSLKEVAALFSLLKHSPPANVNWRQISEDCLGLSTLPYLELEAFTGIEDEEIIEDELTELALSWPEFWHSARAYASARMSPSDLEEHHKRTRETEAESRLKNYFFGKDGLANSTRTRTKEPHKCRLDLELGRTKSKTRSD